jgi:hypothetical protein
MKIKNGVFFGISLLLILPLAYFLFDRVKFLTSAQQTYGVVQQLRAENDRCGRKRSRHNCTKFRAMLSYDVQGRQYQIEVSAGSTRGHNQPVSYADYGVGQTEVVAFDPRQPSHAYRNKLWDIWGAPIATFLIQIATFVASINERRKDKRF